VADTTRLCVVFEGFPNVIQDRFAWQLVETNAHRTTMEQNPTMPSQRCTLV
jgi:hypothetical protein